MDHSREKDSLCSASTTIQLMMHRGSPSRLIVFSTADRKATAAQLQGTGDDTPVPHTTPTNLKQWRTTDRF